jgi:hypothetical protein
MQRLAMFVGFLLSATLCASVTIGAIAHDFHYSRFGMQWNAETGTWQGILRVFTDDLEAALGHGLSEPVVWRLGDEREHPQADDAIAAYTTTNWLLTDSAGKALEWLFVGKEIDYDITFIYLESEPTSTDHARYASSVGFFELFEDQVNEFTLNRADAALRVWLTSEDPIRPILPDSHE